MNNYELEKTENKLIEILRESFEINFDNIKGNILELELHGNKIGLEANDLLYLFFDVEKEFKINIPKEDILSGRFTTIKSISEIILEQKKLSRALA